MRLTSSVVLSHDHLQRLEWFERNTGTVIPFPAPLGPGRHLSSKPKGIFKPKGFDHALSVRLNQESRYTDGQLVVDPDGTWSFDYHQEGDASDDPNRLATNRGLLACIMDRVPVGVLRQSSQRAGGHRSMYEVMGLATPVLWQDGYFFLTSGDPDDVGQFDVVSSVLGAAASPVGDERIDPMSDHDARLRAHRLVVSRRGQSTFRNALIAAYAGRCAVTGCDAIEALEAAHIRPFRGDHSNYVANGLLLRADVHTLLDLQLIAIEPRSHRVAVSVLLTQTSYRDLVGRRLAEPGNPADRPGRELLEQNWLEFMNAEQSRVPITKNQ